MDTLTVTSLVDEAPTQRYFTSHLDVPIILLLREM